MTWKNLRTPLFHVGAPIELCMTIENAIFTSSAFPGEKSFPIVWQSHVCQTADIDFLKRKLEGTTSWKYLLQKWCCPLSNGLFHRVHIFTRDETGLVYLPSPLTWSVHCNFTGDGKCNERVGVHPPPHQPGLILPSWWNVRQKAAVATLCTLWSHLNCVIPAVGAN